MYKYLLITSALCAAGVVSADDITISGTENSQIALDGGDTLTIEENGVLITPYADSIRNPSLEAPVIELSGTGNTIINYGLINSSDSDETSGFSANSVPMINEFDGPVADNTTIINYGTIGNLAEGRINAHGDNWVIENYGNMFANFQVVTAYDDYDGFTLINHEGGLLQSSGSDAVSIRSGVTNAFVDNRGTIKGSGVGVYVNDTDSIKIYNTGSIISENLAGIDFRGDGTHILYNYGYIEADGASRGIYVDSRSHIVNYGTILSEFYSGGTTGEGLEFGSDGDYVVIDNYGYIAGTQDAIEIGSAEYTTINLHAGSRLYNPVTYDGTGYTTATFNVGLGLTGFVEFSDQLPNTINVESGISYLDGNTLYFADMSDLAAQDQMNAGLFEFLKTDPASDTGVGLAMAEQQKTWGWLSASAFTSRGNDDQADYSGVSTSALIGWHLDGKQSLFVAGSLGDVTADDVFEQQSFGLYGGYRRGFDGFDLTLLAGVAQNDTTREIADPTVEGGEVEGSADYNSYVLGAMIAKPISQTATLSLGYMGVYSEGHSYALSDTVAMDVDARWTHILDAEVDFIRPLNGRYTVNYGVGAQYSTSDIDLEIAGIAQSTQNQGAVAKAPIGISAAQSSLQLSANSDRRFDLTFTQRF